MALSSAMAPPTPVSVSRAFSASWKQPLRSTFGSAAQRSRTWRAATPSGVRSTGRPGRLTRNTVPAVRTRIPTTTAARALGDPFMAGLGER